MDIKDLIDYGTVRAVLSVSDTDLPDEILSNYGVEDDMAYRLDKMYPDWTSLPDLEDPAPVIPPTDQERRLIRLLKLYVKYKAASLVADTAPVFILKKISDGNNETQRSDKDGYLWLSMRLSARANEFLAEIMEELNTPLVGVSIISAVQPTRDPVTQPRAVTDVSQ